MIDWIPLIYDLCVVGLVVYFVSISAHRGFVRTVIEFIGYFLSLMAANYGAKFFSSAIFEKLLRPTVLDTVAKKLTEAGITDIASDVQTILAKVPDMLEDFLAKYGVKEDVLGNFKALANPSQPLPEAITDHVVGPIVVSVVELILFLILISLCFFLVRKFSWTLGGLRKIPIIGPANTILGGVVGALEGLLTVALIANLLNLIITATAGGFQYLNSGIIDQTVLFRRFLL
ncbi:CvpA family protein [Zongyangia hominis]|uniref:CvpA family protein n=1 Tax=Zongyangia hominis TaxID=2763677 RepID=A0A926EA30_9FIRM|nr:CvpA family protein [Zongyangia hominis]MBC8569228.1 CvpA family protein [Zongyangia hominis]